MPLPLLLIAGIAMRQATQGQSTAGQTQQSAPPTPFSTPFTVAEPDRLAITPKIDGVLDDEEWDPLTSSADMKSYFEWEPGKLHIAAQVPTGHDLVASFDLQSNGWLIGKDNLEVRVSNANGQVTIVARLLDGTGIAGPKWIALPGMALSSRAAAVTSGPTTVYEATIVDPGLGIVEPELGGKIMLRMDDPLSTDPPAPAYLPRSMAPVKLVYQRAAALPTGLIYNVEGTGRAAIPGEGIKVRLTFKGTKALNLKRLEMHSEGFAKNDTNQNTVPFPDFDNKGRSFVDYETNIASGSLVGYRVLKATLMTADNINAEIECSYRVGPLLDFAIPRQAVPIKPVDRSIRYAFYAKSNSGKRVSGEITLSVPEPLRILNGAERKINIQSNRGDQRQTFELLLPPNTAGTFPVKFSGKVNGVTVDRTEFITIGGY